MDLQSLNIIQMITTNKLHEQRFLAFIWNEEEGLAFIEFTNAPGVHQPTEVDMSSLEISWVKKGIDWMWLSATSPTHAILHQPTRKSTCWHQSLNTCDLIFYPFAISSSFQSHDILQNITKVLFDQKWRGVHPLIHNHNFDFGLAWEHDGWRHPYTCIH